MNIVLSTSKSINKVEKITAKGRSLLRYVIQKREDAKKLAETIVETPNDSVIIPFSDYPGPLINEMLSLKLSALTVCEPNEQKRDQLKSFVDKNKPTSRVFIEPIDLEQLTMKTYCGQSQKQCGDIMKRSCQNLNLFSDAKPGKVKYLVPLRSFKGEMSLLNQIYDHTILRNGLYAHNTFPSYYILMTNRRLSFLEATTSDKDFRIYKSMSIVFNTVFRVDNLLKFDLKHSFGLRTRQIHTRKNSENSDIHLVRLEPKRDIVDKNSPEALSEFKYFVKQLMTKPTANIMPILDKWFKISQSDKFTSRFNLSNQTRSGDLTREAYWDVYRFIRTLPTYQSSLFLQAYQSDNLRFTREREF